MLDHPSYPSLKNNTLTPADGIERIKELLDSAINRNLNFHSRIREALDRICGPMPDAGSAAVAPIPPLNQRSVYTLLGDLERSQNLIDAELRRFQEQMP